MRPAKKPENRWLTFVTLSLAVALAYGEVVNNGFFEIDDPTLLYNVSRGADITPRFRPLFEAWNRILYLAFGLTPWPYYVAGLALHAFNACACATLTRRLTSSAVAGTTAGFVFALWYAPQQTMLWIAANCGLLSVAFILLAGIAWHSYVSAPALRTYLFTMLAMAGAMASKEDCVVLAPLLIGIDATIQGVRAFRPRLFTKRYALLAALAGLYLAIAFRPSMWSESPVVGRFALGPELVPRLLGNVALLFAIGQAAMADTDAMLVAAGAVFLTALAVAARRLRHEGRVLWTGLSVLLFALALTLPGGLPLAGTRYTYPAMIGWSLIAGGLAEAFVRHTATRPWGSLLRGTAAFALVLWLAVQVAAIHSTETWRYERGSARLQRLTDTTREAVIAVKDEPSAPRALAVIAPEIWNPADYASAMRLFLSDLGVSTELEWIQAPSASSALAATGGRLDPARVPIFTSLEDGRLQRIEAAGFDARLAELAQTRRRHWWARDGLPIIWLRLNW